jgi:hypothetical protein
MFTHQGSGSVPPGKIDGGLPESGTYVILVT